jgi:hypothetical protein
MLNGNFTWIAIKIHNEIKLLKASTYALCSSSIEKELTKSENRRIVQIHCKQLRYTVLLVCHFGTIFLFFQDERGRWMVSYKGACCKQYQYAPPPVLLRGHDPAATCAGVVRAHTRRLSMPLSACRISPNSLKKLLQKTTVRLCCCFRTRAVSAGVVLT